ncbi:hypothetical protein BH09ACT10_BH09ACT10_00100 [soil metagenome]
MCFSATASFTAGTALTVVGVLTLRKSQGKRELPLALVPLLFGIQQLTEGVVWVSLSHDLALVQSWATYLYSMFSHVVWPILVPFAIFLVEPRLWRRKAISVFVALGLTVGLYLFFFIVWFPVTARVTGHSIRYDSPHFYTAVVLVGYLLATCISGLFSSHRCVNVFGMLAFLLAIVAAVVSITTFVSVWCFYAAILSLLVYLHFSGPMQACRHMLPPVRQSGSINRPVNREHAS